MSRGKAEEAESENIYQMYVANGNRCGFWVVRNSWTDVVAIVRTIDRKREGVLAGAAPYYGNPPVRAGLWDWKLKRWRQKYYDLTCAGTYAYRRIDTGGTEEEEPPAVRGRESSGDGEHPEGRSEATEGSGATFAEPEPDGRLPGQAGGGEELTDGRANDAVEAEGSAVGGGAECGG
jgi:hypothetical protein